MTSLRNSARQSHEYGPPILVDQVATATALRQRTGALQKSKRVSGWFQKLNYPGVRKSDGWVAKLRHYVMLVANQLFLDRQCAKFQIQT